MAELKTDFNVAPYYDDYDEDKQYYRILFRPATAVQARELTQLQTIMQRQISRFGDSIYKDGTIIEGVNTVSVPGLRQVKFADSNSATIDFTLLTTGTSEANNYLLVSNETGLRATIFKAFDGDAPAYPDTNRAYVKYLNQGSNSGNIYTEFKSIGNETIDVYSTTQSRSDTLDPAKKIGILYTLTANSTTNTGSDSAILASYKFVDIFPTSVSNIDLSYDSGDTIEEFTVEFQVQTYEIISGATAAKA